MLFRYGGFHDRKHCKSNLAIDHLTVVGLVAWPLNESEAGVTIQYFLLTTPHKGVFSDNYLQF